MESKATIMEHTSLAELLDHCVNELSNLFVSTECSSPKPELSSMPNPKPLNYRSIKFSRYQVEQLTNVETILADFEDYLADLYGREYLLELRSVFAGRSEEMRLYEYVIRICQYAEEQFNQSDELFESTLAEWRQLLEHSNSLLEMTPTVNDEVETVQLTIRGINLDQLTTTVSTLIALFTKMTDMMYLIGGTLHIPSLVDGVLLRHSMTSLYSMLQGRLRLLNHFEQCLAKIKLELAQLNEQFKAKLKEVDVDNLALDDGRSGEIDSININKAN